MMLIAMSDTFQKMSDVSYIRDNRSVVHRKKRSTVSHIWEVYPSLTPLIKGNFLDYVNMMLSECDTCKGYMCL